jgi:hypothetical protein
MGQVVTGTDVVYALAKKHHKGGAYVTQNCLCGRRSQGASMGGSDSILNPSGSPPILSVPGSGPLWQSY